MARKRASGGGRKRSPDTPRAQLSIRMQENDRAQLEAAAKRRGWTVTEELLWRLRASFARDHERQRDPPLRAWCFLISELASFIHYETPNWHRNPFWYRAFKLGLIGLLDALEPQGEVRPPKALDPSTDEETPEAQAEMAVNIVLHLLRGGRSREEYAAAARRAHLEEPDRLAAAIMDDLDLDRDVYARVRQDLQLIPTRKSGD
jgi:hypothetical protein